MHQDLNTRHDWPVKKKPLCICQSCWKQIRNAFPVISGIPLGAQNKDFGDASQTLLNGVKLRLWRRLGNPRQFVDSGFHAMDSEFQVLNSIFWEGNFDSGFQSLVRFQVSRAVFRIPKPRIPNFQAKFFKSPDSTSKNLPDFGLPYMERLGYVVRCLYYCAYMSGFAQTFIWFLIIRINHF